MIPSKWRSLALGCIVCAGVGLIALRSSANRERTRLVGSFHSVAHKGAGTARIVERSDGTRLLELVWLKTYPAADLEVCMVNAPDAEDNATVREAGFYCLGALDQKQSNQIYPIPTDLDLNRYRAVTIWSTSYQVNFTTAPLAEAR